MSGMTPLFSDSDLERWFDHFQLRAEERIFKLLQGAGEKFIEIARKSGKYTDHTGNLRSSIGYVIAVNGKVASENFEKSDKGTDKATGEIRGRKLAAELSLSYNDGYVLIGVAGMEYAFYVEAKGYDVATGASIQVTEWLKKSLDSVFSKIYG